MRAMSPYRLECASPRLHLALRHLEKESAVPRFGLWGSEWLLPNSGRLQARMSMRGATIAERWQGTAPQPPGR
jgi:hypothetical protein